MIGFGTPQCGGTGKINKGLKCVPCKGTGLRTNGVCSECKGAGTIYVPAGCHG